MMPLTRVNIKSELRGSLAATSFELTFVNPSEVDAFECTNMFRLDKSAVLTKFEASIDDRVIATKIKDKV